MQAVLIITNLKSQSWRKNSSFLRDKNNSSRIRISPQIITDFNWIFFSELPFNWKSLNLLTALVLRIPEPKALKCRRSVTMNHITSRDSGRKPSSRLANSYAILNQQLTIKLVFIYVSYSTDARFCLPALLCPLIGIEAAESQVFRLIFHCTACLADNYRY